MKFISSLFLIALLSFAACFYLEWWSIAIVAFLVAIIIPQSPGMSFLTGFLALFFLWGLLSFWISSRNNHILAHKMSIIIFKIDNPYLLMLASALIGALVAGLAAVTASFLRMKKVTPD
jgi:hypothetical protein